METTRNEQQQELIAILEQEIRHQQWLIEGAQTEMDMLAKQMKRIAFDICATVDAMREGEAFMPKGGEHMQTVAQRYAEAEARMVTAGQAKRSTEVVLAKALAAIQ